MIEILTPGGEVIRVSGLPFTRTLPLTGRASCTRQQQQRVRVGLRVKLPSGVGPLDYSVIAVSTDRLSWRDENAAEHYTGDVLL